MNTNTIRIERLSAGRAAEAGDLLASSHFSYPSFRHLFPGRGSAEAPPRDPRDTEFVDAPVRQRVLRVFMTAAARDAAVHAHALIACDDEGILGVALWMPPGTFPMSARRKARMTPALLRTASVAPRSFPAFTRVGIVLERAHPGDESWYLQALGVHPRAQRRGIGRQLMLPVLALADESGSACHLHTSDPANVAYYQRFGFEVSQPAIQVFANGPNYIGMTRLSVG
jgi:ribosomal protein S18 acetylase RimI-like enzyme